MKSLVREEVFDFICQEGEEEGAGREGRGGGTQTAIDLQILTWLFDFTKLKYKRLINLKRTVLVGNLI